MTEKIPKVSFWDTRPVLCMFWAAFLFKHKFLESWASHFLSCFTTVKLCCFHGSGPHMDSIVTAVFQQLE